MFTPSIYAKNFQDSLEKYEYLIQQQNHLTKEYIDQRKSNFKWIEEQFNLEMTKLQHMNATEFYINSVNMNLPKMYWDAYILWLEKIKKVYDLDSNYFRNIMNLTTPVLQLNPFLKAYSVFDVYNHFNLLKPFNSES